MTKTIMLHKTLEQLLFDRKISKTAFAEHLGVTRATLNDYLKGKTFMPSDKIEKTAAFFNVPVSYLFGETKKKDETLDKRITKLEKQIKLIAKSLQIEI